VLSSYEPAEGLNVALFRFFMVVAAVGTVLAAGYLLWMLQRVAMGKIPAEWENAHIHDVHMPEWIAWTPLLILILALGVFPGAVFNVTDDAVQIMSKAFIAEGSGH